MMFSKILIALSVAAVAADVPTLTSTYCADVIETMTVDGSAPVTGNSYHLCVDNVNVRYNTRYLDGSQIGIFNGTDYWHLTPDATQVRAGRR